jgi:hypothetical protein
MRDGSPLYASNESPVVCSGETITYAIVMLRLSVSFVDVLGPWGPSPPTWALGAQAHQHGQEGRHGQQGWG